MAIIICPECGRQISDKAPTCPQCGVEIAGKISICNNCGNAFFTADGHCTKCGRANKTQPVPAPQPARQPVAQHSQQNSEEQNTQKPKSKSRATIMISFLIALAICGGMLYFYVNGQNEREEQEMYEKALISNDPMTLETYLSLFADAPQEHLDSIKSRLEALQQTEREWDNVIAANSRSALKEYIEAYPDSPHRQDALNKIDSLDWIMATQGNNVEAYKKYMEEHPNGQHTSEAQVKMDESKRTTVQPEEKEMVESVVRKFFQAINGHNESGLRRLIPDILTQCLNKAPATGDDVVLFMEKLFKDNVENINWHLDGNSYQLTKEELPDGSMVINAVVNASKDTQLRDGTQQTDGYKVKVQIDSNYMISSFNMSKLVK